MPAARAKRESPFTFHVPEPGPSLRAIPSGMAPNKDFVRLLSKPQKLALAGIATRESLPARAVIYRADSVAEHVFIIERGVVKSFRDLPSGKRRIAAFWYAEDIFGLAEAGRYVNTLQTITPTSLYRLRRDGLMEMLQRDPELDIQLICKMAHEIRAAYRHTILVARRDAPGRMVMFLRTLMEQRHDTNSDTIDIPMTRSDIAAYLGISLEAVVRACHKLEKAGVVDFVGRHTAHVRNHAQFEKIAAAL